MQNDKEITLSLTQDESLILFEFLSRFTEEERLEIAHQSEERALWNLLALLEQELSGPLKEEYESLLDQARNRLSDNR